MSRATELAKAINALINARVDEFYQTRIQYDGPGVLNAMDAEKHARHMFDNLENLLIQMFEDIDKPKGFPTGGPRL